MTGGAAPAMGRDHLLPAAAVLACLAGAAGFLLSRQGAREPLPSPAPGALPAGRNPARLPPRLEGESPPVRKETPRSLSLRERLLKEVPPGYELPPGAPRLDYDDEGNVYYVFPDDTVISPRVRPFTLPGGKVVWRKVILAGGPMKKEQGVDPKEWEFKNGRWVKKREH